MSDKSVQLQYVYYSTFFPLCFGVQNSWTNFLQYQQANSQLFNLKLIISLILNVSVGSFIDPPCGQYLPVLQSVASGSDLRPDRQYRPAGHCISLRIASSDVDELSQ